MKSVDVNTIESISVLKDKSATSLYGDKGLNGVVMITTKKWCADVQITNVQMIGKSAIKGAKSRVY